MDSVTYLANNKVRIKLDAEVNQKEGKYTLKDNEFYINDMGLGLNGWVQMQGKAIETDLTYKTLNGNFKDLLSIIPGIFTKSFEGLKADGSFTLDGLVKGTYIDSTLPKLVLNLKVNQGQFQYPNLPSAVTGVDVDLTVKHAQGPLRNMAINLKKFEMKMGKNPISARASIQGLDNMLVDGEIKAKMNLTEISNAFPMDGLTLKGLLAVDAVAKGVYNAAKKRLPAVTAELNLVQGYVKSTAFPEPIEALTVQAFVQNGTGRMEDTKIRIPSMSLSLSGQPFTASALIEDLVNYRWDIAAKGTLDQAKMTKI
jgi:energy-converting hydrogenase Eha subunit A